MENNYSPKGQKTQKSFDLIKLVSYIGIGVLIVCGFISIVASLFPAGTLDYAILGVLCLTSGIGLMLLLTIAQKQGKCHSHSASATPATDNSAEVEVLKAKLEKERAVLSALFALDDSVDKANAFRAERTAQYEAKVAVDRIKGVLNRISEITEGAVRAQYMNDIERIIADYNEATAGDEE